MDEFQARPLMLNTERETFVTVVDTDLATLLDVADEMNSPRMRAVVKRVEAELFRLREERDAARKQSRESSGMYVRANEQITELLQQQSFMERKLAAQREDIERLATRVETAEAEVERLRSDKDERDWRTLEIVTKRAEAAGARCARLQQALREIAAQRPDGTAARAVQAAREALAAQDAPARGGPYHITEKGLALLAEDTPADKPLAPAAATTPTQSGGVPEGNDGAAGAKGPLCIRCWNELDNGIAVDTPADSQPEATRLLGFAMFNLNKGNTEAALTLMNKAYKALTGKAWGEEDRG